MPGEESAQAGHSLPRGFFGIRNWIFQFLFKLVDNFQVKALQTNYMINLRTSRSSLVLGSGLTRILGSLPCTTSDQSRSG